MNSWDFIKDKILSYLGDKVRYHIYLKETLAILNITSYDQNNKVTLPILQVEPVAKLNIEQPQRQLWEKKKKKTLTFCIKPFRSSWKT